jgi:hypothetical protein
MNNRSRRRVSAPRRCALAWRVEATPSYAAAYEHNLSLCSNPRLLAVRPARRGTLCEAATRALGQTDRRLGLQIRFDVAFDQDGAIWGIRSRQDAQCVDARSEPILQALLGEARLPFLRTISQDACSTIK